jgi:hypothetical protein
VSFLLTLHSFSSSTLQSLYQCAGQHAGLLCVYIEYVSGINFQQRSEQKVKVKVTLFEDELCTRVKKVLPCVSLETSLLVFPHEIICKISHLANTGYLPSLFRRRFTLSSRAQKYGNRREFPELHATDLHKSESIIQKLSGQLTFQDLQLL